MSTGKKVTLLLTLIVGVSAAVVCLITLRYSSSSHGEAISEKQQRKTAVHEAGHTIVALVIDPAAKIEEVVVQVRLHPTGRFGHTQYDSDPRCETAKELFDDATNSLAGRAADTVLNGAPDNGAGSDLSYVNRQFCSMCKDWGLCGSLLVKSDCQDAETKKVVEKCLNAANARAEAIVTANKERVDGLAKLIMDQPVSDNRRRVSEEQLKAFIAEHPLVPEPADAKYECP